MSINYFYQAWNFHDLHFFISYYEVYIHSQNISFLFFFFFWELLELHGKEVNQEKVNEGESEGSMPLPSLIHQPWKGRGSSLKDGQPDTCITKTDATFN